MKSQFAVVLTTGMLLSLASCTSDDDSDSPNPGVHQLGQFSCDELESDTLNSLFEVDEEWEIATDDAEEGIPNELAGENDDDLSEPVDKHECEYLTESESVDPELIIYTLYFDTEEATDSSFDNYLNLVGSTYEVSTEDVSDLDLEWDRVGVEDGDYSGFYASFMNSNSMVSLFMSNDYPEDISEESRLEILGEFAHHVTDF